MISEGNAATFRPWYHKCHVPPVAKMGNSPQADIDRRQGSEAMRGDLQAFHPLSIAAKKRNLTFGTAQFLADEPDQLRIGLSLDRRRLEFDLKHRALFFIEHPADDL